MTITITIIIINRFLRLPLRLPSPGTSFLPPLRDNNYPLFRVEIRPEKGGGGLQVEREIDVADRRCSRHPLASGPNPSQSRRAQRSLIKRAPVSVIGQKSGLSSPSPPLGSMLAPVQWVFRVDRIYEDRSTVLFNPPFSRGMLSAFICCICCMQVEEEVGKQLESGDWDSTAVVREETRERIWKNCLKIFVHTLVPIYILFNIEFIE